MENAALQQLFLTGTPPKDLNGFYHGSLNQFIPQTLIEHIGSIILKFWLPWYGKNFEKNTLQGYNFISPALLPIIKWKYGDKGILEQEKHRIHIYPFQTRIRKSIRDSIDVMQLNYDISPNPTQIRSIVDELVCIGKNEYLGKAYIQEKNDFRLIAIFTLKK